MFVFPLQSVLNVRLQEEKARQQDLAVVLAEELSFKTQSAEIDETIAKTSHKVEKSKTLGLVGLFYTHLHGEYIGELRVEQKKIEEELVRLLPQMLEKRERLKEAQIKRKSLEILFEKEKAEYEKKMRSFEQKMLDETASIRFFKRSSDDANMFFSD